MSKQIFKVVDYTFGLLGDISIEQWLSNTVENNPDYEIFQIDCGSSWSPGGTSSWRRAYLVKKI